MITMKPYLTVDIETTGVDTKKSRIVQLSAIYDDGGPLESLKKLDIIVDNGAIDHGEPYALALNAGIFKAIVEKDARVLPLSEARRIFKAFVDDVQPQGRVTLAGKNAANFDMPIMAANGFDFCRFHHRVLDVGPVYFPKFGYVPTLGEINRLLGRAEVSHNALEDCWDVVHAVRAALK